jgi:hypothetical protein
MTELAQLILAIFSALLVWTVTVVSAMLWLSAKFRQLEQTIYREIEKRRRELDPLISDLYTRTQRLEFKVFGFTHSGMDSLTRELDQNFPPSNTADR